MSTSALASLGIILVLVAIPLGFMLAPLTIGVIVIAVSLRRVGTSIAPTTGARA